MNNETKCEGCNKSFKRIKMHKCKGMKVYNEKCLKCK